MKNKIQKIKSAISILENERRMREIVFKNQPEKRNKKVSEMDFVIELLMQLLEDKNDF